MPRFSAESLANLATVDERLQRVLHDVIRKRDCKVTCGRRSREEQEAAFERGTTRVQWPNSNHNVGVPGRLARAVDAPPYPILWGGRIAIDGTLLIAAVDELLENRYQAGFARGYLDLGGEHRPWRGLPGDLVRANRASEKQDVDRTNLDALIRFYDFGGYVLGSAERLGVPLRWGGDWDRDHDVFDDQTFQDLVHFELPRDVA